MTAPNPTANGHLPDPEDEDWTTGDDDIIIARPSRVRSWAVHAWWRLRYRSTGGYPLLPGPDDKL